MTNNAARSHQGAALSVTIIPDCLCSLQSSSHLLPHGSLPCSYGNKYKLLTNKHKHCHCSALKVEQNHPLIPWPYCDQEQQNGCISSPPPACVVVLADMWSSLSVLTSTQANKHPHIIHIIVDSLRLKRLSRSTSNTSQIY